MADLIKHVESCSSLIKTLYFHYYDTYVHQNSQVSDLSWEASIHKATWTFDHVVFGNHLKIKTIISSLPQSLWPPKLVGWSIKSHDSLITWFCKNTLQTKSITSPLSRSLWPPKLADGDLPLGALTHKATRPFDHLVLQNHMTI